MAVRNSLIDNTLDSDSFESLLHHFRAGWKEKTMAGECARVLTAEGKRRFFRPELLDFRDIECLPLTKRIDGMIPLSVPIAKNVYVLADEMIEEAFRLELPLPPNRELDALRRSISLCYFAFFHGRRVRIDLGMRMELTLSGPASPTGGERRQPLLVGRLPFGGRCTVLKTERPISDLTSLEPGELEHVPHISALRAKDGPLLLAETPAPRILSRVP